MASHKEGVGCLTTATWLIHCIVLEMCVSLCEYIKVQYVALGSHNGQRVVKTPNHSLNFVRFSDSKNWQSYSTLQVVLWLAVNEFQNTEWWMIFHYISVLSDALCITDSALESNGYAGGCAVSCMHGCACMNISLWPPAWWRVQRCPLSHHGRMPCPLLAQKKNQDLHFQSSRGHTYTQAKTHRQW